MKILKHILSAAALLVLAAACNHDPDELVLPASDLSIASHGKVVVNGATIDEDFTLVWSAVRFGAPTEVEYTVEAQLHDGFTTLGSTSDTHFTCKNSELFDALGISLTGNYDIDFRVTAASATGETKQRTLTVPFEFSKITYLWVPGAYQGWNFSQPISRLLQGEDGIFRGFVHMPDGGEFKFASQPDFDAGTNYGAAGEEGILNTDGDAGNLSAAAGLYYVEVDIEALTYLMLPLESVSLIGEGVGGWDTDVEMTYDAAAKTWVGFADAAAGKEYKVRFNKMWDIEVGDAKYNCSLGGDAAELQIASNTNLVVAGDGGITAFTLSIFDYPYNIKESAVEENDDVLYLVSSLDDWNYLKAPKLLSLGENKFYGLANFSGASSPEVLFSRLQTPLGTRFGGSAAALESYAGGAEATPIAAEAGLRFYAVDLSGDPKVLYDTEITDAAVVLAGEPATTIAMTAAGAGKWTLKHTFDAVGKFTIALNGGKIACGGTDYPAVLGGSCTGLVLDGSALNMTKGEHELVLDLTAAAGTLSIDGEVADLQLYPETLGVTGDFGDISWTIAASPQLQGNVETGEYKGYVSMYGLTYGFKFTYGDNTWVAGQAVEGSDNEFVLGVGDNMMIAEGLYRWDVSLDAMTAKATPLSMVGLIGSGIGSWDVDVELVRDEEDGLYKAAGVVCTEGEFKIRFNGGWDYSLGGTPENLIDNAGNMPIEAGTYDFALDLTHTPYKVTFTAAE
ncbi:MAG: SusE domain-containing protein [Alistipes sp.]|nr:SusE domain-containing protein [Alistipes senegalensis]MCM1250110.1 SusE domain-containing protein [Alistipes sp.]